MDVKTYSLEDQPVFKNGAEIMVDMSKLGSSGVKTAKVVGVGMKNVISLWIVDFGSPYSTEYPYQTLLIPHIAILKSDNQ